jgi:polyphosphate kinase 2 (PPK2 family)
MSHLGSVDLTEKLSKKDSDARIAELQKRLLELRLLSAGLIGDGTVGPPVCVLFEGWDAAGKGGAIKRLVGRLDPRHVRVGEYAAPTAAERAHHFLWRFESNIPGWGEMSIFDRSWYGRVLVERVEGFATNAAWGRAYEEICDFERLLVQEGTTLIKFFLHISPKEQLARFESRRDDPLRAWKLTEEDWRNRDKRDAYSEAIEEMLDRTDKKHSRWTVIAAESKHYARVAILEKVVEEIESGLGRVGIDAQPPTGKDYDPPR